MTCTARQHSADSELHVIDVSVRSQTSGYLPEALLNFVVLLGWNPKEPNEFLTMQDMIDKVGGARWWCSLRFSALVQSHVLTPSLTPRIPPRHVAGSLAFLVALLLCDVARDVRCRGHSSRWRA